MTSTTSDQPADRRRGQWVVRPGGPLRLWDDIEAAVGSWQNVGSPPQSAFTMTIAENTGQRVHAPGGLSWLLPE
ncbi:hypothetical protein [Streptomyces sp. NBRC 109706]|uniref:hypothetical protein n=1 Tax=Streptomyces sp. NBRC 109706 TaxID=1550035 RepID=UPI00131D23F2|nr:hypothetical protein [Streptomyces sp. NBRC 109706]